MGLTSLTRELLDIAGLMARLTVNLGRTGEDGASDGGIEVLFDLVGLGSRSPRLEGLALWRPIGSGRVWFVRRRAMLGLLTKTEDRVGRLGPTSEPSVSLSTRVF